jgi:hypothetical protein
VEELAEQGPVDDTLVSIISNVADDHGGLSHRGLVPAYMYLPARNPQGYQE